MSTPSADSGTCNIPKSMNPSHMMVITGDLETQRPINSALRAQLLFTYSQHRIWPEFGWDSYPFKNLDFSTRCWSFGYLWPRVRQRIFHSNVLKGLKNSNPAGAGSWFLGPLQKFSIRSFWEGGIITKYEWSFPLQIQRFFRAQSWGSWTDRINMGSLHPREDGAHVRWRGNSLKWGSR